MADLRNYFEKKLDTYPAKNELLTRLMLWASDKNSFFGAIESNIVEKSSEEGVQPQTFVDQLFTLDIDNWFSRFS